MQRRRLAQEQAIRVADQRHAVHRRTIPRGAQALRDAAQQAQDLPAVDPGLLGVFDAVALTAPKFAGEDRVAELLDAAEADGGVEADEVIED
jgi:hypothetical protein